jgi:subtilisin family serine protease
MKSLLSRLALALAVWLGALGFAPDVQAQTTADHQDQARQVLVLLHLPTSHLRSGSDYSGAYGDEMSHNARRRIAGQLARDAGLTMHGDWPMPMLGVDCYVMNVPAGRSVHEAVEALSRDKRVSWAQPMGVFHARAAAGADGDPLFAAQPATVAWNLGELHKAATGANVRVAVIDSMIEARHPDLSGQVQVARNFAPDYGEAAEQHGTSVAGVIGARANNGLGIAGVAPGARLMALRACWQGAGGADKPAPTVCNTLTLAKAIDFAITQNAQVINMSLSGPPDPLLGKLIDVAVRRGITVVGAVDKDLPGGGFPAGHPGVVAVAEDSTELRADGIYGAPGRGIPTTLPGGRWFLVDGSSYAAAHISGLFALLYERRPARLGSPLLVLARGGGRKVDACATLLRANPLCNCTCAGPTTYTALSGR